jgi:uncharacterized coiled-coil protein SlyX
MKPSPIKGVVYKGTFITQKETPEVQLEDTLAFRLRKRAEIRSCIQSRKSVLLGEPDRISELLLEAAEALEVKDAVIEVHTKTIYELNKVIGEMDDIIARQEEALNRIYHYGYYPENK